MSRENRSKYAILGFLDLAPMSGYDVKKFAAYSLAHFWNEDYGHIYPTLRALEAEGLAVKTTEAGQGKPDRHVYVITDTGRAALSDWLAATPLKANLRVELLLKVFFGSRIETKRFREMLNAESEASERALRELRETGFHLEKEVAAGGERGREALFQRMSLRYGIKYYEATRDWCRETMEDL
ncbi:MAG: PadR family transcriptional regulator [Treponemataceae bacterium]